MSDAELFIVGLVFAPLVIVALVAMVRGYHVSLKIFRPRHRPPEDQPPEERKGT